MNIALFALNSIACVIALFLVTVVFAFVICFDSRKENQTKNYIFSAVFLILVFVCCYYKLGVF